MQDQPADRWIFHLYLALILWAPLPLGSVQGWSAGLMQCWILLLTLSWWGLFMARRVRLAGPFIKALPVFYLLAGWLLLLIVQILPLPPALLQMISPQAAKIHQLAAQLALPEQLPQISVYPFASLREILLTLSYILFLALTLLLVNSSSRIRTLVWMVILSGLLQAIYGGIAALTRDTVAVGSFVNRNHLAGYLEMCLAIGIGLLISESRDVQIVSWQHRIFALLQWLSSAKFRLRLALALMVVTLVLTHSRSGNSAFFISLLIASAAWIYISRKRPSMAALVMILSIFIIDIVILGKWFGLDQVVQRIQQTTLASESRDDVWREAVAIQADYPLSGIGAGAFVSVFPAYRDSTSTGGGVYFAHAHNDYLEILLETSPLGLLLLGAVMLLALRAAWHAMSPSRRSLLKGLGFGGLMGMIAILYHSFTDFNLRIPANAMMFTLLIGLSYIGAYHRARRQPTGTT